AVPAIGEVAKAGWSATTAITPSPEASVAAGGLLTGVSPAENGLLCGETDRMHREVKLLPELLRSGGYATACFPGSRDIRWSTGLSRGFQVFADAERDLVPGGDGLPLPGGAGWDPRRRRRDPVETVQEGLRWLGTRRGPCFLWLHLEAEP